MEAIKSKNVLVVEDDENSYLYLLYALEEFNYNIIRANNGLEAIQIFTSLNIDFEFILMDLKLPIMDGYQACEEIRKIDPFISIIAQTASYLPLIEKKLNDCKFNAVVVKPFTVDKLFEVIEKTLSHKKSKVCMPF